MRYAIKSGLSLLLVMTALAAVPAMAQDHGYYDRYDDDRDYLGDRDHRPPPPVVYRPDDRRPVYDPGYAPPPPPRWARGGRYYDRGYGPTYVVRDYRGYGLPPPPRGYYWRHSDAGDYLLVAVATGIITDLILRH